MEFIKVGKNYMVKGSNGRIVSEKEKLQLENNELVLKDITSNNCQEKATKKIAKNKKKIKELEEVQLTIDTALEEKEVDADDTIEETDTTI